jgi:hypothetical protein
MRSPIENAVEMKNKHPTVAAHPGISSTLVVVIQEKQKDQGWNEQSDESCPVSEGDHPRQLSERDPDLDDQDSEQRQDGEDAFQVYGGPLFFGLLMVHLLFGCYEWFYPLESPSNTKTKNSLQKSFRNDNNIFRKLCQFY